MRKLVLIAVLCVSTSSARADFALGGFFGDPTGLDLKFGMAPHSSLDLLIGWYGYHDSRFATGVGYGHLTYLVTPIVGHGESVLVPLRLGIGGALFGDSNNLDFGVRFPLELGLRFRSAPLEIYGEIALLLAFANDPGYAFTELQGGIGIRFYF